MLKKTVFVRLPGIGEPQHLSVFFKSVAGKDLIFKSSRRQNSGRVNSEIRSLSTFLNCVLVLNIIFRAGFP